MGYQCHFIRDIVEHMGTLKSSVPVSMLKATHGECL